MNRLSVALGVVVGIVAVGIAGAFIYGIVVDPAVAGPIAGATAVVGVGIAQRRWEKKQELERVRRERISPIYEELVEILQNQESEERVTGFFKELTAKLLLYGPAPIIREWSRFKRQGPSEDPIDPTMLLRYERFLLLIRKDFGHDDSELEAGDLLRTYVNDLDEMFALWQAKQLAAAAEKTASAG